MSFFLGMGHFLRVYWIESAHLAKLSRQNFETQEFSGGRPRFGAVAASLLPLGKQLNSQDMPGTISPVEVWFAIGMAW